MFGKKKKEEVFPSYERELNLPEFPSHEEKPVLPPLEEESSLPLIDPSMLKPPVERQPVVERPIENQFKPLEPLPRLEVPREHVIVPKRKKIVSDSILPVVERVNFHEERPLFIKLDKYHEVLRKIDKVKAKLDEIDRVLAELSRLRREEDKELDSWHHDINVIKEELLAIDRELFEK